MNKYLEISKLSKSFNNEAVFKDVSFSLIKNEILTLVGPSGCGKSTLLNIISGLDTNYSGNIIFDSLPSKDLIKNFSFVQQKDLLIPWKNVIENAVFGLELEGMNSEDSYPKAIKLLNKFNLENQEKKFPHQLSGGMRQRVSLMRSVLVDRPILLLDEPFASLDSITRENLQDWLLKLIKDFELSAILVTHDINEAVKISNRILVMGSEGSSIIDEIDISKSLDKKKIPERIKKKLIEFGSDD